MNKTLGKRDFRMGETQSDKGEGARFGARGDTHTMGKEKGRENNGSENRMIYEMVSKRRALGPAHRTTCFWS